LALARDRFDSGPPGGMARAALTIDDDRGTVVLGLEGTANYIETLNGEFVSVKLAYNSI
jgi:hypothetical protein